MRTRSKLVLSFVLGFIVAILIPLLLLATGAINMGAVNKSGLMEQELAGFALERSMAWRVPDVKNPLDGAPAALVVGFDHYRENCVICHGAPEVPRSEIGEGLNPPAPDLSGRETREMSDGKIFWTIKNGIRMTGMPGFGPTHSDQEIWGMVAFVRHLPKLTPQEKAKLLEATGGEEAHHHAAGGEEQGGKGEPQKNTTALTTETQEQ
jgi:mono/diheme cytochrome c family protein